MAEKITIDDQINYLEAYANMVKAQHDMLQMQIKMLKAGKDMQQNLEQFSNIFTMMNPFFNQEKKK